MNIREVLRQTIASIAAHKLRSFLTMFGIIWGITSVILLVGLGKGFSRDQKERLKSIGVDLAIIWGGRTSEQAGGYAAGRPVRLSIQDAYTIKNEAYLIKTVSPEQRCSVAEVSRYNAASRPVRGVWPDYQRFRSLKVEEGRLMTDDDEKEGRRVVVLGVESGCFRAGELCFLLRLRRARWRLFARERLLLLGLRRGQCCMLSCRLWLWMGLLLL